MDVRENCMNEYNAVRRLQKISTLGSASSVHAKGIFEGVGRRMGAVLSGDLHLD